jgi:hypothetical protein
MTGYKSKRAAAQDKLDDDDVQGYIAEYELALKKEYQRGYEAGKATQPEQEPVAWMTINEYGEEDDIHYENPEGHLLDGWTYKPLYTHPPSVQPKPEPLEYWNAVEGWVKIDEVHEHFDSVGCGTIYKSSGENRVPVYTTPPQRTWVSLTDDQIKEIVGPWGDTPIKGYTRELIDQIEAKLRENNNG